MTARTPSFETFTLKAGRNVALRELSVGSRVVLLCHAAASDDPDTDQTAQRGVRLIGIDWRASARAADDLAEVLDAKGLRPVGVAGVAVGAELAAMLAARRPDMVSRLVIVAAPEPSGAVSEVNVKTLLLYAQSDLGAGPRDGRRGHAPVDPTPTEASAGVSWRPARPSRRHALDN